MDEDAKQESKMIDVVIKADFEKFDLPLMALLFSLITTQQFLYRLKKVLKTRFMVNLPWFYSLLNQKYRSTTRMIGYDLSEFLK